LPKVIALLPNANTPLAFPLKLKPFHLPQTIATLGEATRFLAELPEEMRQRGCWKIAIGALAAAVQEPRYILTATLSLQTALTLERMLQEPSDPS
jgi:hypothetical protein